MTAKTTQSERVYRGLTRLYPRAFQADARNELLAVFRDLLSEAGSGKNGGFFRFWFRTLQDLAVSLFSEWGRVWNPGKKAGKNPQTTSRFSPGGKNSPRGGKTRDFFQDIRVGVRGLIRSPGYALITILVMGLGIGANTTIFSVAETLFLEDPPHISEPEQLLRVTRATEQTQTSALGYPDARFFQEETTSLKGIALYDPSGINLTFGQEDQRTTVRGWFVSGNYFSVLGVRPAAGRWFSPDEDETPGTHPVAVISHGFWERAFGGDPNALGSSVILNGRTFQVVGVAPKGFRGISPIQGVPEVWVPINMLLALSPDTCRCALERVPRESWFWLEGVGRMEEGSTVEAVDSELASLAKELEDTYPDWNEGISAAAHEGYKISPGSRSALGSMTLLLFSTALVVLVIAGANLAILMLARNSARKRDTGLRVALGAGRGRIIWHSLAETLLICLAGGGLGVLLAFLGAPYVAGLLPETLTEPVTPDGSVLVFGLLVSVLAALVVGFLPALRASRADVRASFQPSGSGQGSSRFRNFLVVSQVGLSLVLVSGAALLTRSLMNARSVDLGFALEDRVIVSVNLANHGYDEETGRTFVRQALSEMEGIPGVQDVATMIMVPFRGGWGRTVLPEGSEDVEDNWVNIGVNSVSPSYFEAMEVPLVEGRFFDSQDFSGSLPVVIVNEAFASQIWPGQSAVGKRLNRQEADLTIVGVVETATYYELGEEPEFQVYFSVFQDFQPGVKFLLHETPGATGVANAAATALKGLDPALALSEPLRLETTFEREIGRFRSAATMVGLLSTLALFLTLAGLYGVLSYLVVQRTREIGIQVALGASRSRVRRDVLFRGVRLAVIGVVFGTFGALALTGLISSFLFGVEPLDPLTFLSMPLLLTGVAALASLIPAQRAIRIDPMEALRGE